MLRSFDDLRVFAPAKFTHASFVRLAMLTHDQRPKLPRKKIVQMPSNSQTGSTEHGAQEGNADCVENFPKNIQQDTSKNINALWRFLEVHNYRVILFVMVILAVKHFCVLNLVIIIFVSLSLCFPSLMSVIVFLLSIYIFTIFIARIIYQLNLFQAFTYLTNSKNFTCNNAAKKNTSLEFQYVFSWIGFEPIDSPQIHMLWDFTAPLIIFLLIGLQMSVHYRQRQRRVCLGLSEPLPGVIFPEVEPTSFDTNLLLCMKCILNYGFYKFGLEISMGMMVAVAWIRMDFLGAVHILWALFFLKVSRWSCRSIWPAFVLFLALIFPLQYLMAIGLPVEWCIDYPWRNILSNEPMLNDNLLLFLDLANNRMESTRFYNFLIADFFLLLIASAQLAVFRTENEIHPAGLNASIYNNEEYVLYKKNPRYDFIVEQKSFVDFIKIIVFNYGHWITLITVLSAGLGGTSIFAFGYLTLAFYMLWQANDLYTMSNYAITIKKWIYLAYYTTLVMLFKVSLQVFGCSLAYLPGVDLSKGVFDLCIIEQVFSIVCVNRDAIQNVGKINYVKHCDGYVMEKINRETKIGLDMLAFIFILFQLRILNSWFFQRCIIEFRCEMIQAKRGAILVNQLIEKEMREQNEQQKNKFREIKYRTAEIRRRYQTQQRCAATFLPQTYEQAKRVGDYYMFEYDPNMDELVEPIRSFIPEVTPGAGEFDKLDPAQLLHVAIQRDLNLVGTLSAVEAAEKIKDDELRMIAAIAKSQKERNHALQLLLNRQMRKIGETENFQKTVHTFLYLQNNENGEFAQKHKQSNKEDILTDISKIFHSFEPNGMNQDVAKSSKTWGEIMSFLQFVLKLFLSILGWAAAFLNRRSREHRYVSYVLNKEKEKLKFIMNDILFDPMTSDAELLRQWEMINVQLVTNEADIRRLEDEARTRWEERNVFARFTTALANCFNAHTDVLCFLMATIAHAMCCGLITLPLPLMVFFWGTLANPRPSKTFWVCMIGYTEFVIATKFIFQFLFWPWNRPGATIQYLATPYPSNYVFGVQQVDYFAIWDVALLILLFFHRYMLRRLGLWKDANVQDTFTAASRSTSPLNELDMEETQQSSLPTLLTPPLDADLKNKNKLSISDGLHTAEDVESGLKGSPADVRFSASGDVYTINSIDDPKTAKSLEGFLTKPHPQPKGGKGRNAFYVFACQLIYPKFRYIRDLYPLMFFLDVLCFMIVVFGYNSFGEGENFDVITGIKANRVPLPFVLMLIVISIMVVVDRALYLRKAVVWKLVYQILSIIFLHIWIFGVLPNITQEMAYKNRVPLYLYIVKCTYFLASAWQIRNGYPPLCIGNFLTHSYGLINMILFKIFMLIPFLFELRTAIDWTWTDTSMPLFDYFNMENFYGVIYNIKCIRTYEQSFPTLRGESKGAAVKYLMGVSMILTLILVIWCPLLLFSMLNHVGAISNPDYVKIRVGIEGYPSFYSMQAQDMDVKEANKSEVANLIKRIANGNVILRTGMETSKKALSFVREYQDGGIMNINFRPESEVMWQISTESLETLKSQLLADQTQSGHQKMKLKVHLEFRRPSLEKFEEPSTHSQNFDADLSNETRIALGELIDERISQVEIPFALPMSVIVPNEGQVLPAEIFQQLAFSNITDQPAPDLRLSFNNLTLKLIVTEDGQHFWLAQLQIHKGLLVSGLHFEERIAPYGTERHVKYIQLVVFADRVFPSYLPAILRQGIIPMYMAVVLLVGRIIRSLVTNSPLDLIISEMPNPDYLLKICLDIYLVREARDFILEQDLFAKLIFLFRSPATLIKWTRYKAEQIY